MRGNAPGRLVLAALCALPACSGTAPARPQAVIVLDTDAPLVGMISTHPELSLDAAVDTVRVDVIGPGNKVTKFLEVAAPDVLDWPISFGVVPRRTSVRLRIRAFRGQFAERGTVDGESALEPPASTTINRVVDIPTVGDGVQTWHVLLSEDCLGIPPSFLGETTTCVDAARQAVAPDQGLEASRGPTRIGTWPAAREVPCTQAAPAGATCIPGGFTVMGDERLKGIADGIIYPSDPAPTRPVRLSPFFMDVHEYTVGRLKQLLKQRPGAFTEAMPQAQDESSASFANCTWLGSADDGSHDGFPLDCITNAAAEQLCELDGGTLPTEAQWEHAARGRGQHLLYPWGDTWPDCCAASIGRKKVGASGPSCPGSGIEPVGSHADPAKCDLVDRSRDGVLDLAGSLAEMLRDHFQPYTGSCWSAPGVLANPRCDDPGNKLLSVRGAGYSDELGMALLPLRTAALSEAFFDKTGFRCVYPEGAP